MKSAILLATLLMGSLAQAEVYNCYFTEPFYTITYNTESKVLTVSNDMDNKGLEVITDVSYATVKDTFKVGLLKDDTLVMTIKLTGHATDGMSNNIYPFEAKYLAMQGPNNGVGGCSTEMWPTMRGEN